MKKPITDWVALSALLLLSSAPLAGQESGRYCNTRFNFCLSYPVPPFSGAEESDNKDGVAVRSPDTGLELQAAATNNVLRWTLAQVLSFEKEEMEELYGKLEFRERQPDKNSRQLRFRVDGKPHFFEVHRRGEVLIFLRLAATRPVEEAFFEKVLDQLQLDTRI